MIMIFRKYISLGLFFLFFPFFDAMAVDSQFYDISVEEIVINPTVPTLADDVEIAIRIKNKGNMFIYSSAYLDDYAVDFEHFNVASVIAPVIDEENPFFLVVNCMLRLRGILNQTV